MIWSVFSFYATWTQTRKANGDMVVDRVVRTINRWKTGKFMSLLLRPRPVNTYVLSRVWFKCGSVDLSVGGINLIKSSIKSCLYADLLVKPIVLVMCRPSSYGGLNVMNVKFKALATLIRCFIKSEAIFQFRHNLLHSSLYRYYTKEDTSIADPRILLYYPVEVFQLIGKWVLAASMNYES